MRRLAPRHRQIDRQVVTAELQHPRRRHRRRSQEGEEVLVLAEPRTAATPAAAAPAAPGGLCSPSTSSPRMISVTFRYPSATERRREQSVDGRRAAAASGLPAACPRAETSGDGRLDHFVFCGPSKGNWTLARPASSSVVTTACAAATMRAVASDGLPGGSAHRVERTDCRSDGDEHKPNEMVEAIRTGERIGRFLS